MCSKQILVAFVCMYDGLTIQTSALNLNFNKSHAQWLQNDKVAESWQKERKVNEKKESNSNMI